MEVCCRSPSSSSLLLSNSVFSTVDERRPPAYKPTPWDYGLLQSLGDSHHTSTKVNMWRSEEMEALEQEVRQLLKEEMKAVHKLELVETVERLGLKHKFRVEIEEELNKLSSSGEDESIDHHHDNLLHAVSLRFTLFRRHAIFVSQDVFKGFMDESGKFKQCLVEDVKGLLSLYEASFLGWKGEGVLDEAREFSRYHLKRVRGGAFAKKVKHALELPLHWTALRLEARWFMDAYEEEDDCCNTSLLKLAKMEFNRVQSLHHKELADLARWCVQTGMNKLPFARNGLIECYMWTCLMMDDPEYQNVWTPVSKMGVVITLVDDVFDAYGSEDELELFTRMVERWSISEIDQLPTDIQMVFLSMFNTTNEICFEILKERGFNCISHLSKMWATLCGAYLKESKWYRNGIKPSFEEYIENGIITSTYPLLLSISNLVVHGNPTTDIIKNTEGPSTIIKMAGILGRVLNDLGTSSAESERGDNVKSIQCYMIEKKVSEKEARRFLKGKVVELWKTINEYLFEKECSVQEPFFSLAMGICRGGHFFYNSGDGYGDSQSLAKKCIKHILIKPIPIS